MKWDVLNAQFLSVTGCLTLGYVADHTQSSTKAKAAMHLPALFFFTNWANSGTGLPRQWSTGHRASTLLLIVVNAIILWNTVCLSRAVDYIRSQGIIILEELLSSVSLLPWGHISLTGDYLWNEIDHPLERYRPLRTNRFNPKNFTFP